MKKQNENDRRRLDEADVKPNDDDPHGVKPMIDILKDEIKELDGPLSNRAFLLGIAYLAEVISNGVADVEDAKEPAKNLCLALLDDVRGLQGYIQNLKEQLNRHAAKEVK